MNVSDYNSRIGDYTVGSARIALSHFAAFSQGQECVISQEIKLLIGQPGEEHAFTQMLDIFI